VAAGSNPVSPTIKKSLEFQAFRGFFFLTEIHNIPPNYPCFSLTVVETVVETFAEFMGIHNEYIFIFCIKVFFPLATHITLLPFFDAIHDRHVLKRRYVFHSRWIKKRLNKANRRHHYNI
jgi:hypothetical protein